MEMYGSDLIQNYDVYSPPSALTPPISLHTGAAEEKPDLRLSGNFFVRSDSILRPEIDYFFREVGTRYFSCPPSFDTQGHTSRPYVYV